MTHAITWLEMSALIASMVALKKIRHSKSLRLFPVLLGVIVTVEAYETFLAPNTPAHKANNVDIYNVQVPVQHLIYLFILYYAAESRLYKKYLLAGAALFAVFAVATDLFFTPKNRFNAMAYCFGAICIIGGIVAKFYEMLQNPSDFNFLRNPFFYMLFAYLLFLVGTLPYFTMSNWLYFVKGYKTTVYILVNVMSVLNITLYATYTIAFLWMTQKKGSY